MIDTPGFSFWYSRWPAVCLIAIGSVVVVLIIRALIAKVWP